MKGKKRGMLSVLSVPFLLESNQNVMLSKSNKSIKNIYLSCNTGLPNENVKLRNMFSNISALATL
jgi:hypothetical protein